MSYLDDLFSLEGLNAVVTGGSSGIGRGIATALAGAGASVHLVARDADKLATVAAEIGATWEVWDVGDAKALSNLAAGNAVQSTDILVTCAGVNHRPPLADTSDEQYAETMAVNLEAPYRLGQAAGPRMAERGYGRILNIGSQQSWSAFGNSGVYGVTKAAVTGLSRSQAEAWSRSGVTANTIVPGFVVTPMTLPTVAEPGREEALAARTLVGRNGLPEDFAGLAVFLASRASGFVTGQTIAVDGGFSVH
ncbi:SDR family oxidoreductase [Dermacoccus abyssi]|uniref:SDR family oxidoreductase n=1 Tax=Dermacoccus abyssi TaxID=322596 RepID=A0ABX5Z9P5_9MICO|nr:SDR family oxidoreductase [Dermacoccus abyssi]